MPVVRGTVKNASGVIQVGFPVKIELMPDSTPGFVVAQDFTVSAPVVMATDAGGNYEATLIGNDNILPPANSFYTVWEGTRSFNIRVPTTGGPYRVEDLLADYPVPPPTEPTSLFGMKGLQQSYDLSTTFFDAADALNTGIVRLTADFAQLFPTALATDFAALDAAVDYCWNKGLKICMCPTYNPGWLGAYHGNPTDHAVWATKLALLVSRYLGKGVVGWEIWNEPNHGPFWSDPSPTAYTDLLAQCAPWIRNQDSAAVIVTGGTSPRSTDTTNVDLTQRGYKPSDWLVQLYLAGAAPHFDAVGHHPYCYPFEPTYEADWNSFLESEDLHNISVWVGDPKPVWGTEWGYPTGPEGDPFVVKTVSEATQATRIQQAFAAWRAWSWGGPLIYFCWKDDPGLAPDPVQTAGIYQSDGVTPKVAAATFQAL